MGTNRACTYSHVRFRRLGRAFPRSTEASVVKKMADSSAGFLMPKRLRASASLYAPLRAGDGMANSEVLGAAGGGAGRQAQSKRGGCSHGQLGRYRQQGGRRGLRRGRGWFASHPAPGRQAVRRRTTGDRARRCRGRGDRRWRRTHPGARQFDADEQSTGRRRPPPVRGQRAGAGAGRAQPAGHRRRQGAAGGHRRRAGPEPGGRGHRGRAVVLRRRQRQGRRRALLRAADRDRRPHRSGHRLPHRAPGQRPAVPAAVRRHPQPRAGPGGAADPAGTADPARRRRAQRGQRQRRGG